MFDVCQWFSMVQSSFLVGQQLCWLRLVESEFSLVTSVTLLVKSACFFIRSPCPCPGVWAVRKARGCCLQMVFTGYHGWLQWVPMIGQTGTGIATRSELGFNTLMLMYEVPRVPAIFSDQLHRKTNRSSASLRRLLYSDGHQSSHWGIQKKRDLS